MVPGDYVVLLQVMRRGFTIGQLVTNPSTQVSLLKASKPITITCRGRFEPKTLFSIFYKSNGPILIHAIDKERTVYHDYYIQNCLKPVVKEI